MVVYNQGMINKMLTKNVLCLIDCYSIHKICY